VSSDDDGTAREGVIARLRAGAATGVERANASLTGWRARSQTVDVVVEIVERDRTSFGTVVGSAIALRLFVFLLPTTLFLVGVLALVGRGLDPEDINETAGLTASVADQIAAAMLQQPGAGWLALGAGAFGMVTSGRVLARVMIAGSSLAWNAPVRRQGQLRVLRVLLLVMVAFAVSASIVNRVRIAAGIAVGGASILLAIGVYVVLFALLLSVLPSGTRDPGAALPGAALAGGAIGTLQAVTQLYLTRRLSGVSELYGAMGVSAVIVGWLFVFGRILMLAVVVNAVLYERFGSMSQVVFGLPILRILPRRVPAVRRFFDLDRHDEPAL
jgi:uncharacterized BrkB/YihY/UPF0761 family membrane protein